MRSASGLGESESKRFSEWYFGIGLLGDLLLRSGEIISGRVRWAQGVKRNSAGLVALFHQGLLTDERKMKSDKVGAFVLFLEIMNGFLDALSASRFHK